MIMLEYILYDYLYSETIIIIIKKKSNYLLRGVLTVAEALLEPPENEGCDYRKRNENSYKQN